MGKKAGMPYLKTASQQPALLGLAGPAPSIGIRGVEVVQCIQDIDNTVPLIAGKTTLVRIYPDPATVSQEGNVTAPILPPTEPSLKPQSVNSVIRRLGIRANCR